MNRRFGWLVLLPLVLAGQDRQELPRRLAEGMADSIAAQYTALESREMISALDRVQARLADAPRFRITVLKGTTTEAHEAVPMAGQLFVPVELARDVKDDDELAGMLAHAMAHAAQPPITAPNIASIPAFVFWPAPSGAVPVGMRAMVAERERLADAEAVELLLRSQIDPSGLLRYLERVSLDADRLAALRTRLANLPQLAAAPPLTSECEVVQALLDELYGKKPAPSLVR